MKTDSLFYRLFRHAPMLVFDLAGLEARRRRLSIPRRGDQADGLSAGWSTGAIIRATKYAGGVRGSADVTGPGVLGRLFAEPSVMSAPESASYPW